MIFKDGQILTAEDINRYLVNNPDGLQTQEHQNALQALKTATQTLNSRADTAKGKVISFPGWDTEIEFITPEWYWWKNFAPNHVTTPGLVEIEEDIEKSCRFSSSIWQYGEHYGYNLLAFQIDYARLKSIAWVKPWIPKFGLQTDMTANFKLVPTAGMENIHDPDPNQIYYQSGQGYVKYWTDTDGKNTNAIFPASRIVYRPIDKGSTIFQLYLLTRNDYSNIFFIAERYKS